ncbi:hypothetical protein [Enterococcus faecalis]|uniref:hypothetical protein n=1 Tax=Enterococcus faecalis TaxID=1351 RepID=UPI0030C83501
MCTKKEIIELLKNPMISAYSIEKMSNGKISTTTASLYRKRVKNENDPYVIFNSMSYRVKSNLDELAKELKKVNPNTKEDVTNMIKDYSLKKYLQD